nr:hypothetical protein Iba_chr13eCG3500 [Ipomoea batatas]
MDAKGNPFQNKRSVVPIPNLLRVSYDAICLTKYSKCKIQNATSRFPLLIFNELGVSTRLGFVFGFPLALEFNRRIGSLLVGRFGCLRMVFIRNSGTHFHELHRVLMSSNKSTKIHAGFKKLPILSRLDDLPFSHDLIIELSRSTQNMREETRTNTTRVSRKMRSMDEKRTLWGHGDRKMNLNHWIAVEVKDESSEELMIEDEHSREEYHEADEEDMTKPQLEKLCLSPMS